MPAKVTIIISIADPGRLDADPYPACYFDPDPDPRFQMKAQHLEKMLKVALIPSILACHLQIDADPAPAYHLDPDPDPDPTFQFDADPDPQH
jgi:hypothetical protein